jgi:hypothetical protein
MESGLIFNQLICEFESRRPCQLWANAERDYISKMSCHARLLIALLVWVVAQLAEHRTVTAASEGSTPFDPPNFIVPFSIAVCRLIIWANQNIWGCSLVGRKRCTVDAEIASSSLVSPANTANRQLTLGKELRQ